MTYMVTYVTCQIKKCIVILIFFGGLFVWLEHEARRADGALTARARGGYRPRS